MKRTFLAIAATTVATMGSAQAAKTTFTFDSTDPFKTAILKTLDDINMTIGSVSDPGDKSLADSYGLSLFAGNAFPAAYSKFTMTFDQPAKLISCDIS